MAFWGVEIKAGKPFTLSPDKSCGRLRITQATLGVGSSDIRSVVQCNVGKKTPILLCCLLPDKSESCQLDLEFEETEGVTFSVIGPRKVYLTGYFLGNARRNFVGDDESESFGEDIGVTDTDMSDALSNDDDYEDSFIDDTEPQVFSPSSSSDEVTNKKKADSRKRSRKRLKKKYALSESEDGAVCQPNTTSDKVDDKIAENEQEDQKPISSLFKDTMSNEDLKRKRHDVSGDTTADGPSQDKKAKKKKKKNNKNNEVLIEPINPSSMSKIETDSLTETNGRTLSSGLIVEELEAGEIDGKVASSGKKVTIHYTGRLKDGGQIFDSSNGKDPLKFRLGKGRVMDGLDLGIIGMRVGGKRRLQIPPELGFGSEGSSRVSPNSWLIMEVELLRVH
ncbi:peptidyl-prolyl cis-trans isomerase FKBP43-like [Amaranthus tricolor]|uniref:peptidyl-prolyl cis-trans isomerase FKBP43-like n=1 Tax=Amaranthus tricolor TaxID=29722 RepID=UPI00258823A0|nr:peptidyl-prolyl cis-trans isomerase FKBP43-like [Amaranthus tricolor]